MKKLDVISRGWGQNFVLGVLADVDGKVHFAYSADAIERGIEHSPHKLKLAPGTQTDFPRHLNGLPGFINDALPDGWGILLMDRMFRQAGRDPATVSALDRLSFIGERAMGALAFRPSADFESTHEDLTLLELAQASRDFVEDHDLSALKTLAMVGGSPHGARPKALVKYDALSGRISSQEEAPGEPWLVKFNAANEHKEVCAIEQVYADMARASGIDMPGSRQFDLGKGMAAFGVQRFDRERGLRVPVQSIAGALHADFREPSIDYVTVLRLTRLFTRDEREVLKAYQQGVFNVVFNNQDDHAKNFAFRMDEHMRWRLSPAYDLTFARGHRGHHQTSVAGAGVPTRSDLLRLAADGGVDRKAAEAIIERTCAQASKLSQALKDAPVRAGTVQEIAREVGLNVKRCSGPPSAAPDAVRQLSSSAKKAPSASHKKKPS